MKRSLIEIYNDPNTIKPILLKNATDPQNIEYFLLLTKLNSDETDCWFLGQSLVPTPAGGFRTQGVNCFYKCLNIAAWEAV